MTTSAPCKSFNGLKGWGFIDYSGQDVFVHIKDCTGLQPKPGDTLTFDLEESSPGKYKAKNVSGGTAPREQESMMGMGMGKATPVEGTGAMSGTVKSFNAAKGFGFIAMDSGEDVFVHSKQCVGTLPAAGDKVKFDIEPSPSKPGQNQAKNVTGGSLPLNAGQDMSGGMGGKGGGYGAMWGGGGDSWGGSWGGGMGGSWGGG
eukprot:CAMPEP_0197662810 /NCGR_PEP_ID=MMETSP1338-20131121/54837_1 /TAXON_ID=43686 ORGANISM="Pelagodinium beii, Strain RCC1491" /NCGR_SAMPLE_ID=MMETSP1338 /ASSEMBLY_ACC=CAM_ASM_000754 /LENGTH=201 /DNA_ID=CAMNT_0043240831 /DNA_START=81 /DNA_END=683 /DNA_ORIENTATION=+